MSILTGKSASANSLSEVPDNSMSNERSQEKKEPKRYNLVLPQELFEKVQELAEARQTTVVDLLRRFIKLGLLAAEIDKSPNASLLIREEKDEREIILL